MTDWIERDLKNIWHPYTQMKDTEQWAPILIDKADGIKLYDSDGNFYYDVISSWWCNVHGHNHPAIKKAINEQLKSLDHTLLSGFTHRGIIELSEKLIDITPQELEKVFYSDNGSTSVEIALKMSFQYWQNKGEKQKTKFVSLDLAYHGDTAGAMSVGGDTLFNRTFSPLLFDTYKSASPYCYRCPLGKNRENCSVECINNLEEILKAHNEEIAAVILEPLFMGAGGMIIYPVEYLKNASRLCREYGVHLILDEVATGFGKTGKMFAHEHADICPDFLCLSKGITSGTLPLAATLTTADVYDAFYDDYSKYKTFYHGHTYTGNPICTAAALESMKLFKQENTLDNVNKLAPILHKRLKEFAEFPMIGYVRCLGLIGICEIVADKKTKETFPDDKRIPQQIYQQGLKKSLILRPLGNNIYIMPPLCTTESQLEDILEKTEAVLKEFST
jgi:adenosylmethionine-8-amino-7-oxononanoate aminotransferase